MKNSAPFDAARRTVLATLALAVGGEGQLLKSSDLQDVLPPGKLGDTKLPNGKSQSEEILKQEFKKNMEDSRELATLTRALQEELEKEDRFVLSLATLKKLDDIEKIAKRIRGRLTHR